MFRISTKALGSIRLIQLVLRIQANRIDAIGILSNKVGKESLLNPLLEKRTFFEACFSELGIEIKRKTDEDK
jgi:hypothetical protein